MLTRTKAHVNLHADAHEEHCISLSLLHKVALKCHICLVCFHLLHIFAKIGNESAGYVFIHIKVPCIVCIFLFLWF